MIVCVERRRRREGGGGRGGGEEEDRGERSGEGCVREEERMGRMCGGGCMEEEERGRAHSETEDRVGNSIENVERKCEEIK